ncbi:MAG: Fic family protein [Gemmatimonadetes bacterium]|nr:Fic family protein [Gemmatimonadota bacterium]
MDGVGKHLPNPERILRTLQNREAQRSSSLEGTYTDPEQQVLFEIDPSIPESPDDPRNAQREVFNYARALRIRKDRLEGLPLSSRLTRELHAVLMDGVRGRDKTPGQFRRLQNQVGHPARYIPPPVNELADLLSNLDHYLNMWPFALDPLVAAFVAHYQFEAIHPFMDGNGRVGRLLLAITIEEWCDLSNQWLYMSEFFDRNKDEYIDRLYAVSTHSDWEGWVEFCLTGVKEQAEATALRCSRLIDLYKDFHARVAALEGASLRLATIVDGLFISPVAAPSQLRKELDVTYPTARSDLRKLASLDIIRRIQGATPIYYYCPAILEITYAD